MAYNFDRDETKAPQRTISLTLQTLGSRGVARVLPELFAVWEAHRPFVAEELVLLEFIECFDALNALNLISIADMVDAVTEEDLSPAVVPWMVAAHSDWFKENRAKRDEMFSALAAQEACDELLALVRACGVSPALLAELTRYHFNDALDLVEALAAAAEYVDTW